MSARLGLAPVRVASGVLAGAAVLTAWLALTPALAPADTAVGPGRKMPGRGQTHVQQGARIPYEEYPPTSGSHWPVWAKWGVYTEPIPEEVFVHNLEHGGIVLLYNCPTPCPDVVRQLGETVAALPKSKHGHVKVVITPNSRIKTRFALLAWTRLDEFDRFDRQRVVRFVTAWQDKGPEDVP
jgi:hypothetical protein